MAVAYRAEKRMRVGHDEDTDTPIYANPGDIVDTEGWAWRSRARLESMGFIKEIQAETKPGGADNPNVSTEKPADTTPAKPGGADNPNVSTEKPAVKPKSQYRRRT